MEQFTQASNDTTPHSVQTLYGILDALPIAVSWARLPGAMIQFYN